MGEQQEDKRNIERKRKCGRYIRHRFSDSVYAIATFFFTYYKKKIMNYEKETKNSHFVSVRFIYNHSVRSAVTNVMLLSLARCIWAAFFASTSKH